MFQINSQEEGMISIGELLKKANEIAIPQNIVVDNKGQEYYNIPAAFDIETSSFYDGEEKTENKRAIMYIWQFGIGSWVTCGRTWEELIAFISVLERAMALGPKRRLIVYVHNLPYEFQFIRKRLKWEKVFLLDHRKPVYAINNGGIEFRCSLKLSGGKSLANVAKDLAKYKVKKMVGDLDYTKLRTPLTPLTPKELKYCENDIRVILCYIAEKIEQDGDILRIPLTNTGYVRNYCRKMCYGKWKSYRNIMSNLTIEPDEYSQLKRGFQGGFTHANAHYVRKVLKNVGSHDFGSSYPGCMVMEKFPMSKASRISDGIPLDELKEILLIKNCLFDVEFFDIFPKRNQEHPISRYKCWVCENATIDNGRVVMASHIITTMTEQDFFTALDFYVFEKVKIGNLITYEKNYLPRNFVLSILELYRKKTILKGIRDEEVNYMISKNMINAGYGMMVTDPVRDELIYTEDNFYDEQEAVLDEAIEKYNKNIRRFLFYPWGVWVTAYARANLFSGIAELGDDYVYSDTDSLKSLHSERHEEYFRRYNNQIEEKIKKASEYQNIDISMFKPKTINGKVKTIGVWEDEGKYNLFKTLGAKRYITFREESFRKEDGDLIVEWTEPSYILTLAGANKRMSIAYLRLTGKPFDNFDDELIIPSDRSGRLALKYIDDETEGDVVDINGIPYHYHELSSIHMEPTQYDLSISDEFIKYLWGIKDYGD